MRRITLTVLAVILLLPFCVTASSLEYEFNLVKRGTSDYSVLKHLNQAKMYYVLGMNDSYIEEVQVLAAIDPQRHEYYARLLKTAFGPAGEFLQAAMDSGSSSTVVALIREASGYYRESQLDRAEEALKRALKLDPSCSAATMFIKEITDEGYITSSSEFFANDARLLYEAGLALYRKGFYETAMEKFRQALDEDPANVSIRRFFIITPKAADSAVPDAAGATLLALARQYEQSGDAGNARNLLEKAALLGDNAAKQSLDEYSEQAADLTTEAEKLADSGKVQEAYLKEMDALDLDPANPEAQQEMAALKQSLPDNQAARLLDDVAAKKLAEGDIDGARLLYEKAAGMQGGGDSAAEAQQELQKMDIQAKEFSDRAEKLMGAGDTRNAYLLNRQALELNPGDTKAVQNAAAIAQSLPATISANLLYNQGVDFYAQKDYVRAMESWHNVLMISPDDSQTKANMAKAQVMLDQLRQDEKKRAAAAFSQGIVFMRQGIMDKAQNSFEYALRLVPEDTASAKKLAEARGNVDVKYDRDAIFKRQ